MKNVIKISVLGIVCSDDWVCSDARSSHGGSR